MTRRVLWLFFWTTMAFWAGCSTGSKPHAADEAAINAYRAEVKGETIEATPIVAAEATDAAPDPLPVASVTGLDRSHWKTTTIGPARGTTQHYPVYFDTEKCTIIPHRPNPLASDNVEAQAAAAMSDATAPFDKRDWQQAPGLVGKALFDVAAAPFRAVIDPPKKSDESPAR